MDGLRWTLLAIAVVIIAGIYWWGRREWHRRAQRDELLPSERGGEWGEISEDVLMAEEFERLSGMISADRGDQQSPAQPARPAAEPAPVRRSPPPRTQSLRSLLKRPAAAPPVARPAAAAAPAEPRTVPEPPAARRPAVAKPQAQPRSGTAEPARPAPDDSLIIALHVMARDVLLDGEALAAALAQADMQFGEMGIYHRHDASGASLFSAANMVKPGTLTPEELPALQTPGIALFMQAPGPFDAREVFEAMLEAAHGIAAQLGAELNDETRSVLTPQTVAHLRERIEAFEFRRRVGARVR
ncbi:cell division protein ZipA [Ectothiorhodospiraceae bacterium 2226]|nr:cell division protein ZipA [Ectothiorhodospiraceae bacterium 2226]